MSALRRFSLVVFIVLLMLLKVGVAYAMIEDQGYQGPVQWDSFHRYMQERNEDDQIKGISYMVSGAIATVGGVAGYYASNDTLSRGIYAVAQSVGVAAIGYGANTYWIGNEYNSFHYALEGSSLSPGQKSELLSRFLERDRDQRQKANWIKIATHSLIALANLYSASHEEDKTVRGVLHFLAGTNAVIAFSYAF
ncbi:MAG: hypothetical protein EOO39_40730 [Cytophagaceae bacterium]|nr:MAG: hypothetical protein EOO39_40730 [Cytophagaceae bacterium]